MDVIQIIPYNNNNNNNFHFPTEPNTTTTNTTTTTRITSTITQQINNFFKDADQKTTTTTTSDTTTTTTAAATTPTTEQIILNTFFDYNVRRAALTRSNNDYNNYNNNVYFDTDWNESDDYNLSDEEEKCFSSEEDFFRAQGLAGVGVGVFLKKARHDHQIPKKKLSTTRFYEKAYDRKKNEQKQAILQHCIAQRKSKNPLSCHSPSYSSSSQCVFGYSTNTGYTSTPTNTRDNKPLSAHENELRKAITPSNQTVHDSGITNAQLLELLNRELTPEDYELLLRLDDTVQKKTVETKKLESTLRDKSIDASMKDEVCSICMSEFEEGEKAKVLPCAHFFHEDCIVPWLSNHATTCPFCKASVV